MTKVDVVSGFLGAGKTTLIQKLIKDVFAGQKVVLVENEFGEIGIDGGFLKEAGIEIIRDEVNGGCICCSLYRETLTEALDKSYWNSTSLIVFLSNHPVLENFQTIWLAILIITVDVEGLEINSYSTVVDAKRCKIYHKNFK